MNTKGTSTEARSKPRQTLNALHLALSAYYVHELNERLGMSIPYPGAA